MEELERQYSPEQQKQRDSVAPSANTVYLQIKSEQVKGLLGTKYAVPAGFVGVVNEKGGRTKVMLPGEEAGGDFTIHLVRDRDVRIPFSQIKALTKDGFDAGLSFELAVTPDVTRRESLDALIERAGQQRRHLDWPLLKAELQPHMTSAVKQALEQFDAAQLHDPAQSDAVRDAILRQCGAQLSALGIGEVELEIARLRSEGFERQQQALAENGQKVEKARAEQEVQTAILRDQLGQELSRRDLEDFLASAREEGLIKEHERKKVDINRQSELDKLEAEYRKQQHNLEATLRKLVMEDKLELDTMMLEKHIGVVKKLKEELSDDRVEVYVNLIQDEKLKAELLERLIHRTMTPEQLKAVAEIEAYKVKQFELSVSRPRLEPLRDTPSPDKTRAGDSVRIASPDTEANRREAHLEEDAATKAAHQMNEALGTSLTEAVVEATRPSDELEKTREQDSPTEPIEVADVQAATEAAKQADAQTETDALLLVASGRRVYAIDPLGQRTLQNAPLELNYDEGRLGSLRSVRVEGSGDERVVLAGARNGVYATLVAHRKAAREYPIGPGVDARTGINAATLYHGYLYATHSEFGLLRWPYLQPFSPAMQVMPELISQFSTTRSLMRFGDRLLFANGPTVLLLEAQNESGHQLRVAARYKGTRHEVTALATDDKYILIADAAGDVYVWDPQASDPPVLAFYAGTPVSDLAATQLRDGRRSLLVSIKRAVLPMLFRDGSNALEFTSPEPIRACDTLNDTIVGLGRDRMRVFAWRANRPEWPAWQFQFTEPVLDLRLVLPGMVAAKPGVKPAQPAPAKPPRTRPTPPPQTRTEIRASLKRPPGYS